MLAEAFSQAVTDQPPPGRCAVMATGPGERRKAKAAPSTTVVVSWVCVLGSRILGHLLVPMDGETWKNITWTSRKKVKKKHHLQGLVTVSGRRTSFLYQLPSSRNLDEVKELLEAFLTKQQEENQHHFLNCWGLTKWWLAIPGMSCIDVAVWTIDS